MKWFLIPCFFFATIAFNGAEGDYGKSKCCYDGYSYQSVTDSKGKTTYGCVPNNQCTTAGIVSSCDKCCGDYTNCTLFFFIRDVPYYKCQKCSTGFSRTQCTRETCCTQYSNYTCPPVPYLIHAAPAGYTCQPPKPPKGAYYCGSACPGGSFCVKQCDCDYSYNKQFPPYFRCQKFN